MNSWKDGVLAERIDAVIRLFLYILIFWLPYSPAVIESCVIICLILWIVKRSHILRVHAGGLPATFRRRLSDFLIGFKPKPSPINTPVAFFLTICLLSVVGSAFFEQSWHNFLTKTLEWFIVYFLVVEVFTTKKHIYIVLAILLITVLGTCLDSIIQFYFTYKDIFLGNVIIPGGRPTAGFKTSNGLGGYLSLVAPVLATLIFRQKKGHVYRLCIAFVLTLTVWSLVITSSRGAWLGASLGILFVPLVILFRQQQLKFLFVLGLFLATTVLCIYLSLALTKSFNLESSSRYATVQWRMNLWRDSIQMIKDKPLFGHGINTFMRLFETYRRDKGTNPTYAHNCYIQLAAETGLAGLFGFLWIVFRIFRRTLSKIHLYWAREDDFMLFPIGLLAGIFAFLIHSFFDTNFYSLQLSVYLWFMIGILMAIHQLKENHVQT